MNQYYDPQKFDARKVAMHQMSMNVANVPYAPALALQPSVGSDGSYDPRSGQKQQMLAAIGAANGCGPVTGQACAPMQYPQSVVQSVMDKQCRMDLPALQGTNLDPQALQTIMALINTSKYATSPARLGWQCDSLTISPVIPGQAFVLAANAAFGPAIATPTRSFAADSLVAASGSSLDTAFWISSLSYDSTNYVDNASWYSLFYTAAAACCLCVRSLKIVEKNTTLAMSGFQGPVANGLIVTQLFGETLFAGNP